MDKRNKFDVGVDGERVAMRELSYARLTPEDAQNLACWLLYLSTRDLQEATELYMSFYDYQKDEV